jgi:Zn-dependent metalloprotease
MSCSHSNGSSNRCYIIPPHIFRAMAESTEVDEASRQHARNALTTRDRFVGLRANRLEQLAQPRGYQQVQANTRPSIVPENILSALAEADDIDDDTRACAQRDLDHLRTVHTRVLDTQGAGAGAEGEQQPLAEAESAAPKRPTKTYRSVYDMQTSSNEAGLPGKLVRKEGQKAVKDTAVNEAYDNVGDVLKVYADIFKWQSIDNRHMPVVSSVHFGESYENAFWDPEKAQMVFGDGGTFIGMFTKAIDVIGHEMTHAVTEHTTPLNYFGQSGALNEHVSDVFGIMIKQWKQDEKADKADWLIGEDCLLPDVKGVALRSMKAPGTAYDDPRFGKDPQPDNFKQYETISEDNGGVHIYSGIPNKAFYLTAIEFGGYSWEKAGQIWWKTMRSGTLGPNCTFTQFANATVETAKELYGVDAAKIVRKSWEEVGVVRDV